MNRSPRKVHVSLGDRSYDIWVGCGVLSQAESRIAEHLPGQHAIVISDAQVAPLYAESLAATLGQARRVELLVVPAGEASKSLPQAEWLWNELLRLGADRHTVILAMGGGVVGDLAGFIAATFARGLPFVQLPTSLLAQVDSSVGGKVAVNLPGAKNIVGAFWQPRLVLADVDVLATLPEREYSAGMAEVIKYGVIADERLFHELETHLPALQARDPLVLTDVIARCCEIKAEVVRDDERETSGRRAILNYGHTFGHALESITQYGQFVHGEAIAIGMMCAARLAARLGRIDGELAQRQQRLFQSLGLPTEMPAFDREKFLQIMRRDKKSQQGDLRLILPTRLGHVDIVSDVATVDVMSVL